MIRGMATPGAMVTVVSIAANVGALRALRPRLDAARLPEGLSPRRRGRCGVYLRYGAEDVGDAVDAAFELRLGGAGGPTFNTGITFVHPLAAGVLDGEATDWGGHLCSSEDARGLVGDDGFLDVSVDVAVFASSKWAAGAGRRFSTFRLPRRAEALARRVDSGLPLVLCRLPRLVRAAFAAPDAVRNGLRVGNVVVPVLAEAKRRRARRQRRRPPAPPTSTAEYRALLAQTSFMLAAGREAWGQRVGDDGARATLGAAGVLPGADYRVVGITRADGSRARRLRPGEGRGATVELYPIFEDRFRGAPDGGWPASLPLGGDDPGDVVLQDRFFTGTGFGPFFIPPKRGDLVFFEPPPALRALVETAGGGGLDSRQFVKRVAAVEGDSVRVSKAGGVEVRGVPRPGKCPPKVGRQPEFVEAKGRVPRGTLYVLGDCPAASVDSRSWGAPVDPAGRPIVALRRSCSQ
ncbi:serine-type peptidase [Aureococcus anophagefferens]|nr:serine-type peptidase [Aureococcus anophagefferens]